MNNCVLCRRESDKLLCISCGAETSSLSCENCGRVDTGVCNECYDRYHILKAIETFHESPPFTFDDFKEKNLGKGLFGTLLKEGFLKKHSFNGFKTCYVLSGKCDDFLEHSMGFRSAAEALLRTSMKGGSGNPSSEHSVPETPDVDDEEPSTLKAEAGNPIRKESSDPKKSLQGILGDDLELCPGCAAELETGTERSQGICRECSRTLYALESLERILEIFNPGDEFNLSVHTADMGDRDRTEFIAMIWILEEFNLLEYEEAAETHRLKPEDEVQKFIIENVRLKRFRPAPPEPVPVEPGPDELECSVCGDVKPIDEFPAYDGGPVRCRECSRRCCAAEALVEIRKRVEPGVEFVVDDIIEGEDERIQITGYIWMLQDFDLIENNPAFETYTLKPDDELKAFHEAYGEGELIQEADMIRECPICGRKLNKSSFYSTGDGKREECRECYNRLMAWEIFKEIRKAVGEKPFRKEELLESFDDPKILDVNIWTLQEYELLEEGPEGFLLKHNPEIEELYHRYHGAADEKPEVTVLPDEKPEAGTSDTQQVPAEKRTQKEIIYIKPRGEGLNLMMNCLVSGNGLMDTLNELRAIIPSMRKCMILRDDKCFELLIEVSVENESLEDVLGVLEDMNWENRVYERSD